MGETKNFIQMEIPEGALFVKGVAVVEILNEENQRDVRMLSLGDLTAWDRQALLNTGLIRANQKIARMWKELDE